MADDIERAEKQKRAQRLKLARERADYTGPVPAAKENGWNPNTYKKHEGGANGFSLTDAKKYALAFGVRWQWLYSAEGPMSREVTYTSDDPAAPAPDEIDSFEDDPGVGNAALINGLVVFQGKLPGSQPETMAKGGAGLGQIIDSGVARIQSNGIASGHAVAAEWVIPPSYLRHGLGGQPNATIIVPVIGHSMEPRLNEGDRLIVDVSQNEWIGDAIYLIDDGGTVFQAKTLRKVTSSYPPRYLVISEADREHPDERAATEFRIVGRVVGRISRA